MQLAYQLKAAGVPAFPCVVSFDSAKQKWNKNPVTPRVDGTAESWADTARRPYDDPAVRWQGVEVIGVPIPEGVVVIDLDTYKGVTVEMADVVLGGAIPWDAALLQTTISGGQHYAFRLPEWSVKQGNNVAGPGSGIDTRVAGKGFICTGKGYSPAADGAGALRFAFPESLPVLPDTCRHVLEHVNTAPPTPAAMPDEDERDVDMVRAALAHIDPTERDQWRDTGFALKHYFHDDEPTGYDLWDRWSAGEFWADGCPATYNGDTQPGQWNSFRAVKEGATITIGSLFHAAVRGGWKPPARFDTSKAFGTGAAPLGVFNDLIDRILEQGADTRCTEELLVAITSSGCNEVQALLLRNELKGMLKSAKVLDKDLAAVIDKQTTPTTQTFSSGLYAKNHTENAQLFLQAHYPEGTLLRSDEVWYTYDGRVWVAVDDADLGSQVATAMLPSFPQESTVAGTIKILSRITHRPNVDMLDAPDGLIVFQNGVLNMFTGQLLPHDKKYLTTKIVPYNFEPNATAPRWLAFLHDIFEGDVERVALLQEWLGYMLSPTYQYQKVMLMIGPKRSGKGTIGNIIAKLVGDLNYTGCSLSSFGDDDFLDSLTHKTVAFSGDTAKSVNRNVVDSVIERIKKISGNDYVDFKRKYKSRLTCKLPTRITLASNHIPRLFDDSEALSNRMLVLPFEVSFLNREDPYLLQALLAEMEGIALWSLQGLARLNANGRFTLPAASLDEMQFIAESYNPLRTFIESCCELGTSGKVEAGEMYDTYKAWALATGEEKILPRKPFVSAFKDATRGHGCKYGVQRQGSETFRGFVGISVTKAPAVTEGAFTPQVVK